MKIRKMDHVGVIVNDLPAAKAFFLDLGLELVGEGELEGPLLDRVAGLNDAKTAIVMLRTPDGDTRLELAQFLRQSDEQGIQPCLANTLGIRHITFAVEDIEGIVAKLKMNGTQMFSEIQQYEDIYKLVYIRGPEGIIIELAEELE